jgi:hypothetical protein
MAQGKTALHRAEDKFSAAFAYEWDVVRRRRVNVEVTVIALLGGAALLSGVAQWRVAGAVFTLLAGAVFTLLAGALHVYKVLVLNNVVSAAHSATELAHQENLDAISDDVSDEVKIYQKEKAVMDTLNLTVTCDGTYGFDLPTPGGTKLRMPNGTVVQIDQLRFEASPLGVQLVITTDSERYVQAGPVTLSGEFVAQPA